MVGQRIKTVRRQRGLSQAQLAHPELSDSYVSLIESGKRTPTPAVLELLAVKLDCSLTYLLNGVTAEQMQEIELALGYARMAMENGEVAEARTRYTELLTDNGLAGLPQLRQEAEYGLAIAAQACGDLDAAIGLLNRLRERDAADMSPERHIDIVTELSMCYRERGDLGRAVTVVEEILGGAVRPVWTDGLIRLGAQLLAAYIDRGDLLRAQQFSDELIAAAETLGTPLALTLAHWGAAILAVETKDGDKAVTHVQRAVAIQSEYGDPRRSSRLHNDYAAIMLLVRPTEAATWRDTLERVKVELAESASTSRDKLRCAMNLIRAELLLGSSERAEAHIQTISALLEGMPNDLRADAHLMAGQVLAELGRTGEAVGELTEAIALLEPLPTTRFTTQSWVTAAQILDRVDETDRSVEAYHRALACVGL
ncbi:hypothetical protein Plo01_61790 [Planobispora longispora]|uniref:HTH cro/C1-type domain-containing protein n=1 Tax=Planobispora longispora TaxID=28887 RepID=A0A8J3RS64_9ACTN|nr:hypothetical protein Plo01_61790 [Planobispora longispora]